MNDEVTRRPLGPNEGNTSLADKPYEHVAWPAWRYNPETGQGQIFESADEVPEGWSDLPPGATPAGEEPIAIDPSLIGVTTGADGTLVDAGAGAGADDKPKPTAEELAKSHKKADLVAMLELMAEKDDTIEFSAKWGEVKLAQLILDNGGPIAEDKE